MFKTLCQNNLATNYRPLAGQGFLAADCNHARVLASLFNSPASRAKKTLNILTNIVYYIVLG